MEAQTVVALVATGVAVISAVGVPVLTFRLALRQDQVRWLRERRADTYVDVLTEAHAEREWFRYETADDDVRERMRMYFTDLRLPPLERARLGSRGTIFASRGVNRLFNGFQGVLARESLTRPRHEADRSATLVQVADAFDELQDAIRHELGADNITLDQPSPNPFVDAFRRGWEAGPGGRKAT
ncbi:MAG TPA: hypothetical protein VGJ59_22165 [Jatrophihabitantaceae bacterium]|jgi:hypothetical protein